LPLPANGFPLFIYMFFIWFFAFSIELQCKLVHALIYFSSSAAAEIKFCALSRIFNYSPFLCGGYIAYISDLWRAIMPCRVQPAKCNWIALPGNYAKHDPAPFSVFQGRRGGGKGSIAQLLMAADRCNSSLQIAAIPRVQVDSLYGHIALWPGVWH